jgi:hypothetical protein
MLLLSFCVVQVLHVKPSEAWLAAFDAASLQHMADFTPQGLADILAAQVKRAGGPREGGGSRENCGEAPLYHMDAWLMSFQQR